MAMNKDSTKTAEKWNRNMKNSTQSIQDGVNMVTQAPGVAAAKSEAAMLAGVMNAINSGLWRTQVSKVTLEEWKAMLIDKGIPRIAAGVDKAQPKQKEMFDRLFSAINAALAEVDKTPRADLETNLQRAVTFGRQMAKSRGKIRS